MEERQGRVVLEVTVMRGGTSAPWQVEVKVLGSSETLTFHSPQEVARYLRQVGEKPFSTQGLR